MTQHNAKQCEKPPLTPAEIEALLQRIQQTQQEVDRLLVRTTAILGNGGKA